MISDSTDILIALGTRPEIIKLAPVIRALEREPSLSYRIVHTGQHYDDGLSAVFFRNLDLPEPDAYLEIGSTTQGQQTADALVGIEAEIATQDSSAVVALGDTNAVLSAALATSKTNADFVHLEAGIRSFDRTMPEEVNRVLADAVTDIAFAPTDTAVENLSNEAVPGQIYHFGNTIVDACLDHTDIAAERSDVLAELQLSPGEYIVATIHRPHNTNHTDRLETIISELDTQDFPVVLPAHPRTSKAITGIDITLDGSLQVLDPLDYLDFLKLLNNSQVVVTDSGGIQEEASILEIPCLTVRPNTERPETVDAGVNKLIEPPELATVLRDLLADNDLLASMTGHTNLYGTGETASRVVTVLAEQFGSP